MQFYMLFGYGYLLYGTVLHRHDHFPGQPVVRKS